MNANGKRMIILILIVAMLPIVSIGRAAAGTGLADKTNTTHNARMKWWRDARFGMFIHWGLYAIPAGEWHGRKIGGTGEWIMSSANIPVNEYAQLARKFNPVRFRPAEWVAIAKNAGMKYLVITSKHHDGFCLFDTKTTDYDVVDATPYGKDILQPLAAECRKQGIHFCVYYSIMDWHHPAQYRGSPQHYNPTKIHPQRKAEYLNYMKRQLKELLQSCDPEVLWFDGEWPAWYTAADGREIYAYLRRLKPQIIINNRVGSGRQGMGGLNKGDQQYAGDFGTPEQEIPAKGLPGVDWESCMTMNDTWGYNRNDQHWKSASTLIRNLVDIASKGGNYLLNVGPTAAGEIPAPSVERLRQIGRWMKTNGASIYGTQASPLGRLAWGRCTKKPHAHGATLYLQVFQWPADGRLRVPALHRHVQRAYLLADPARRPLGLRKTDSGIVVQVPTVAPDPVCSVVALDIGATQNVKRSGQPKAPTATTAVRHLFNGKNLDGWYRFIKGRGRDRDPKGVFTVDQGVIHISGQEWGCLTTVNEYENYHLIVEYKWGSKTWAPRADNARDSGVLIHSIGADGAYGGIWMHGIECQMIEGGTGDLLVVGDGSDRFALTCPVAARKQGSCYVFQPDGQPQTIHGGRINWFGRDPAWKDVKGFRGRRDVEKPIGQWNRYECIARGKEITVLLNGTVVNHANRVRPHKGRLQIQSEAAEVFVRRVDLVPLATRQAQSGAVFLVANKHDDTLTFIDPNTLEITATIATGPNPHEMVITPDQRFAYLSNYAPPGNTISVVDLVHKKHILQIPTGKYVRIHGAAMAPDGKNAYFTAGQTGFVVEVDTATNKVTRGIPTHGKISHMVLVSRDGKRLYTANIESRNVSVIDRASGQLITQIPCGKGCEGMAFTPDGKYLWAANQTGGSITIIDLATNKPVETFPCPGMPVRIRFTKDGKLALVPSWTKTGQLIVLDARAHKEIKRIKVGGYAIGVEISPDGRRAFVGCEHGDGVHVIDMTTLTVEKVIHTGNGPDPMAFWFPPAGITRRPPGT